MQRYIIRRLGYSFVSILGLTLLVFILLRAVPGDVVTILAGAEGAMLTEERMEEVREEFGLNRPLPVQYVAWLGDMAQGDFGSSLFTGRPVLDSFWGRLPVTAQLGLFSLLISVVIAVPIGTISALKQDSVTDQSLRFASVLGLAVPNFWLGTMVVVFGSIWFGYSPPVRYISPLENPFENFMQFVVPAIVLGTALSASLVRMLRSSMLEVMRDDYIRTARAKGLSNYDVVVHHMMKNALIPVITLFGLQVGTVISGTVIIESIFNLPGMGRMLVGAITQRDYPVVQGLILAFGSAIIVVNLITDLMYGVLDPRISYK
jgi:peptide/nickel transport system permease protein